MQWIGTSSLHCIAGFLPQGLGAARLLNNRVLLPALSYTAGMQRVFQGCVCGV